MVHAGRAGAVASESVELESVCLAWAEWAGVAESAAQEPAEAAPPEEPRPAEQTTTRTCRRPSRCAGKARFPCAGRN